MTTLTFTVKNRENSSKLTSTKGNCGMDPINTPKRFIFCHFRSKRIGLSGELTTSPIVTPGHQVSQSFC